MQRVLTTLASKAQALVRFAERVGVDRGRLLSSSALTAEDLQRADARVPARAVVALWGHLGRWTGDPDLGLALAEAEPPSTAYGLVGFRAMTSSTLGEGISCFVRHIRVVSEEVGAAVVEGGDDITLELAFPHAPGASTRFMADRAFASCLRMCRAWTGEPIRPRRVRFLHDEPADTSGYERIFDCPIDFGQTTNALVFDRAVTHAPLETSQDDLAAYLETLARDASEHLPRDDAEGAVAEVLRDAMRSGDPGLRVVARKLGVSARTLQRRLLAQGLTYHGLVDRVRREIAVPLVTSSTLPLSLVSERAGYTEDKAFRRAFRRWTGSSPGEWRRRR
jgi:AraC-like DNA-binding protein